MSDNKKELTKKEIYYKLVEQAVNVMPHPNDPKNIILFSIGDYEFSIERYLKEWAIMIKIDACHKLTNINFVWFDTGVDFDEMTLFANYLTKREKQKTKKIKRPSTN